MMKHRYCLSLLALSLIILLSFSVYAENAPLKQWAVEADSSSQYSRLRWSAAHATGAPDVYPQYRDSQNAWMAASPDRGQEWLELSYRIPVVVEAVEIYQTFNPGAITRVELFDSLGLAHSIWEGDAQPLEKKAHILRVENTSAHFVTSRLRITLDTSQVPGWNQIDAVALIGHSPETDPEVVKSAAAQEMKNLILELEGAIRTASATNSAHPSFLHHLQDISERMNEAYERFIELSPLEFNPPQWNDYPN